MNGSEDRISFELLGEKFTVRSDVPKDYFLGLVEYLDKKLRAVNEKLPTLSNVKALIFASLDILDELFREKESSMDREALDLIKNLSDSLEAAMDDED